MGIEEFAPWDGLQEKGDWTTEGTRDEHYILQMKAEEAEKDPAGLKKFKRAAIGEQTKTSGLSIQDVLRHGLPQEGEEDYEDPDARPWFKVKCRNYRIGGD